MKVRTNRWFKWGHGWINANGDYSVNKRYKRDIRYSVKFENRSGFKIWNTLIVRSGAMVSWEGWIPTGLMQDLIDNNADFLRTGFRDNVTGYSHQDLFDALDSDVRSPQQFRNRLLGENGNRDRTYVLTLFEAYFWD